MSLSRNSYVLLAGAVTHLAYLNRSEHHMQSLRYLQLLILVPLIYAAFTIVAYSAPIGATLLDALTLVSLYLSGLCASLLTYRLFFTPLRRFPGPLGCRISNLYFSLRLTKHNAHEEILKVHEKYGHFVRIGSNDLSISHPKSVQAIYGPQSRCTKAPWYDNTYEIKSIHGMRSREAHDVRRRIWSRAFGENKMRGYEDRIRVFQDLLMKKLENAVSKGASVNATKLFSLFMFDVMGDLAFGEDFGMLEADEVHWAVKAVAEAQVLMGLMLPTWLFRLLTSIPNVTESWWRLMKYWTDKLDKRIEKKDITSDIVAAFLKPLEGTTPTGAALDELRGDTQLLIVAGSDTSATTLACTFYELSKKPEYIDQIRKEIAPHVKPDGHIPYQPLQSLEVLNAVINETLRLHAPVSGLNRTTPPEGLDIGGTFVPGNMNVSVPQYVIGRSEDVFTNALEFIPERWSESSTLVKEKSAFAPFSLGPYNCVGRPVAMLNLRTTIAKILNKYDVCFAEGEDGSRIEGDMKIYFTTVAGPLYLKFSERKV